VAGAKRTWLAGVVAYSLAGALASSVVGAALGASGGLALPPDAGRLVVSAAALAGMTTIAWDLGWIRWRLLEPRRQTRDLWNGRYGWLLGATLWGFDLGLVVTTRFTFAGAWVLVSSAFLVGDALLGSALFLAYWLGRAASVWIGPLLLDGADQTPALLEEINDRQRSFRSINFLGVGLLTISLLLFTQF
jgi:hypothetical protein